MRDKFSSSHHVGVWINTLLLTFICMPSCSDKAFVGKARANDPAPPAPPPVKTTLQKEYLLQNTNNFWVITRLGNITNFTLDGTKITATKQWTVAHHGTGIRTYVTEGGLVFMHNNGHVWFVDPVNTPPGPLDTTDGGPNFYTLPNEKQVIPGGDSYGPRGCQVSYKDASGNRFLAIGYDAGKMAIIPQAATPPYAPIWAQANTSYQFPLYNGNVSGWGYSCFIDQANLIYYGQWANGATNAVNLKTMVAAVSAATIAPNGPQISETDGQGAYAMAGDRAGNVFNKKGYYTFAKDDAADVVWTTPNKGGTTISLYPFSCLQGGTNCDAPVTYQNAEALGPLSALPVSGGGVIGLTRGDIKSTNGVYMLQLKDPSNINGGVNATKLATVEGDPYMYSDFTGNSLYTQNNNLVYSLTSNPTFQTGVPLNAVTVTWVAATGAPATWDGLELDARCYLSGQTPPDFAAIANMQSAGAETAVQVPSCHGAVVDTVELRVVETVVGQNHASRIKMFTLDIYQGTP